VHARVIPLDGVREEGGIVYQSRRERERDRERRRRE